MRLAALALLLISSPALAAGPVDAPEAWRIDDGWVRAAAAGISVPQTVGLLSLEKSGEISDGGEGVDNYAQFASSDGVIQATVYIYLPSYADAAISAYMTDKAILDRFGPGVHRTRFDVAAAGGHGDVAIRSVYESPTAGLTTAAAFIHAGAWMVKVRVTGPGEQRDEVTGAMDALLAGLRFDASAPPLRAAALPVGPCPVADGPRARLIEGPAAPDAAAASEDAFSRDGRDALCVRGAIRVGDDSYDMLQPASASADGATVLIPLDDAGKVMRFDRDGSGYRLRVHQVGRTEIYHRYDRVPTSGQIAAIIDGSDRKGATMLSSTTHDPRSARTSISMGDAGF